jgi:hypothetical protein
LLASLTTPQRYTCAPVAGDQAAQQRAEALVLGGGQVHRLVMPDRRDIAHVGGSKGHGRVPVRRVVAWV